LPINIPGVLSILFRFRAVPLAETPGLIEINSTTISRAHTAGLLSGKGRLQKLRDLNAPEVIIQNEIRVIRLLEDVWDPAGDRPEDYAYVFKANEEHFAATAFEETVVKLSALTQLERLDLSECSITDKGLAQLRAIPGLRELLLCGCTELTDEGLAHLAALPHLASVDLSECSVSDTGLAHLWGLKELRVLTLEGCNNITQAGVVALKAALPNCDVT